jgi:hypothetical protein
MTFEDLLKLSRYCLTRKKGKKERKKEKETELETERKTVWPICGQYFCSNLRTEEL